MIDSTIDAMWDACNREQRAKFFLPKVSIVPDETESVSTHQASQSSQPWRHLMDQLPMPDPLDNETILMRRWIFVEFQRRRGRYSGFGRFASLGPFKRRRMREHWENGNHKHLSEMLAALDAEERIIHVAGTAAYSAKTHTVFCSENFPMWARLILPTTGTPDSPMYASDPVKILRRT